jgi:hypothetical protein
MAMYKTAVRPQGIGLASLVFGALGLACYWYLPLGIVLSLAGLVLGITGWLLFSGRGGSLPLVLTGILISVVALVVDCVVAGLDLETFTFTALR